MQIHNLKLSEIKPYDNNPRKKRDIKKVANSIKEFGFQQPIVVDKSLTIIVGHSRYLASKELGLDNVPVIIADLPPEKVKSYRIADNKTNQYSDWDYDLLHKELGDLLDVHYDLSNLGFEEHELESIITFEETDTSSKWLDYDKEWQGMPEYKHEDLTPHRSIIVHLMSEEDIKKFSLIMNQDIGKKTKYIYFPKQEKNILKDKGYASE